MKLVAALLAVAAAAPMPHTGADGGAHGAQQPLGDAGPAIGAAGGAAGAPSESFSIECVGRCARDATPPTAPLYALVGGGNDPVPAFQQLVAAAGFGDFVVLRTSGGFAYNDFVLGLGASSVTTIVFHERAASFDPAVVAVLAAADGFFMSGGDQARHLDTWRDSPVEDALRRAAPVMPIGGTSAGMAVLAGHVYDAARCSVTSTQALQNPLHRCITLSGAFVPVPFMADVVTDTHFYERDRMGRLMAMLAQMTEAGIVPARAIASDEGAAAMFGLEGNATAVDEIVYFVEAHAPPARPLEAWRALDGFRVTVTRADGRRSHYLRLDDWESGNVDARYELEAHNGELVSTQGNGRIY